MILQFGLDETPGGISGMPGTQELREFLGPRFNSCTAEKKFSLVLVGAAVLLGHEPKALFTGLNSRLSRLFSDRTIFASPNGE